MSVVFVDGFDHYAGTTPAQVLYKYDTYRSGGVTIGTANPRRPDGRHLVLDSNITLYGYVTKEITAAQTVVIGFGMRFAALTDHKGFWIRDNLTTQCSAYVQSDGSIKVFRGSDTGTLLGQSSAGVITANTWHYFELKIYIDNAPNGTYDVTIDGATVLSGTGDTQASGSATADVVYLRGCGGTSGGDVFIDDLYIDNADLYGDCRVDTLWPDGAGNSTGFTPVPSGTDNYANIDDDNDIDDDTTYNIGTTAAESDLFTMDDLGALFSPGTSDEAGIYALALSICAKKDQSGEVDFRPECRDNGGNYVPTGYDLLDGEYSIVQEIWDAPPSSSSTAWVESSVNAVELGYFLFTNADQYVTQVVGEVLRENGDGSEPSTSGTTVIMS